jgi:hypothetical protein
MFFCTKTSCLRTYLQVVENRREGHLLLLKVRRNHDAICETDH